MIRIKLYYDVNDYILGEPICRYDQKNFYHLVQGHIGEERTAPPLRDADSLVFIREIDHAEFVEGDWYSVVTPFGRTNVTALCGGTQYALTVIENSRYGIYTTYKEYEDDIWSRLADLSLDVLIAMPFYNIGEESPYLPFQKATIEKVVIENYRYEGREIEAYLGYVSTPTVRDGKLYVSAFFDDFLFDWRESFSLFIKEAESLLKSHGSLYKHPPTIMSIEEFAWTLKDPHGECFIEYLDEPGVWEYNLEEFRKEEAYLKGLTIHNYMRYVPTDLRAKYPIIFTIKKRKGSGACTVSRNHGYKYPAFSELFMEDFVRLSDKEKSKFEKLVIIFDISSFYEGAKDFKNARWAWKFHDNVVELYDDIDIMKEFIDFIKQSYDAGLVEILG